MSEQEQEEIIKKLREQVVKIDSQKPSSPQKVEKEDILEKAKEAGEAEDNDDALSAPDIH